jgi:hypothetical protein
MGKIKAITSWAYDKTPEAVLASMAILTVGAKLNELGFTILPKVTGFCASAQPLFFTGFTITATSLLGGFFLNHITGAEDHDSTVFLWSAATAVGLMYHLNITPAIPKEFIGVVGAAFLTLCAVCAGIDALKQGG